MSGIEAAPGPSDDGEFGASFPSIEEEAINARIAGTQESPAVAKPAVAQSGSAPAPSRDLAPEAAALPAREAEPAPPDEPDPPARPVWYGALMTSCFLTGVGWLLAYTVLDWDWQQAAGGWNYLIALVFLIAQGQLMEHWHGFPRRP